VKYIKLTATISRVSVYMVKKKAQSTLTICSFATSQEPNLEPYPMKSNFTVKIIPHHWNGTWYVLFHLTLLQIFLSR